jgi:hypothetical protein
MTPKITKNKKRDSICQIEVSTSSMQLREEKDTKYDTTPIVMLIDELSCITRTLKAQGNEKHTLEIEEMILQQRKLLLKMYKSIKQKKREFPKYIDYPPFNFTTEKILTLTKMFPKFPLDMTSTKKSKYYIHLSSNIGIDAMQKRIALQRNLVQLLDESDDQQLQESKEGDESGGGEGKNVLDAQKKIGENMNDHHDGINSDNSNVNGSNNDSNGGINGRNDGGKDEKKGEEEEKKSGEDTQTGEVSNIKTSMKLNLAAIGRNNSTGMIKSPEGEITLTHLKGKRYNVPEFDILADEIPTIFCGRSLSTYPYNRDKFHRDGEPICDQYHLILSKYRTIISMGDGCNWGNAPKEAAARSAAAFVNYVNDHYSEVTNLYELAKLCLFSIENAHNSIIQHKTFDYSVGTTTLLGGLLVRVDPSVPTFSLLQFCNEFQGVDPKPSSPPPPTASAHTSPSSLIHMSSSTTTHSNKTSNTTNNNNNDDNNNCNNNNGNGSNNHSNSYNNNGGSHQSYASHSIMRSNVNLRSSGEMSDHSHSPTPYTTDDDDDDHDRDHDHDDDELGTTDLSPLSSPRSCTSEIGPQSPHKNISMVTRSNTLATHKFQSEAAARKTSLQEGKEPLKKYLSESTNIKVPRKINNLLRANQKFDFSLELKPVIDAKNGELIKDQFDGNWVFILANIGDCKAYKYSTKSKKMEEITKETRRDSPCDASDCGGRIGPYINNNPDLRNLSMNITHCCKGDIIIVCTDGVHDNFDPEMQGKTPREAGLEVDHWDDRSNYKQILQCKSKYALQFMENLLSDCEEVTPKIICEKFTNYCTYLTHSSRSYLENNMKKLPADYRLFPGKMDHTSVIAVRVGEIDDDVFQSFVPHSGAKLVETSLNKSSKSPVTFERSFRKPGQKEYGFALEANSPRYRKLKAPISPRSGGESPRARKFNTIVPNIFTHETGLSQIMIRESFSKKEKKKKRKSQGQ